MASNTRADDGHEIAQLLAVVQMNISYVEGHPTRLGSEVDSALREALEATEKLGTRLREKVRGSPADR